MPAEGFIVLTLKFKQENKKWVSYCEELGTSTFGKNIEEAGEKIKEAILLHLNTLEDIGECENFLRKNKIHFYARKPRKKELKPSGPFDQETYSIPYIQPIHKELFGN